MGEPIGDEFPPGDDAAVCWGLGKTFGVGSTPEKVFLTFDGLVGDYAGANKTFVGIQSIFDSAVWNFDDGHYSGFWWFHPVQTIAKITDDYNPFPQITLLGPLCSLLVTNVAASCTIS